MKRILLRAFMIMAAVLALSTAAYAAGATPASESAANPLNVGTVTYSLKPNVEYTLTFVVPKDAFYSTKIDHTMTETGFGMYGLYHKGEVIDNSAVFYGKKGDVYTIKAQFDYTCNFTTTFTDVSGKELKLNEVRKINIGSNPVQLSFKADYTGWYLMAADKDITFSDYIYDNGDSISRDITYGGFHTQGNSWILLHLKKGKSYRFSVVGVMDEAVGTTRICMTKSVKCATGKTSYTLCNPVANAYIAEFTPSTSGDYYFETKYYDNDGASIDHSFIFNKYNDEDRYDLIKDVRNKPAKGIQRLYYTGKKGRDYVLLIKYSGPIPVEKAKVSHHVDTEEEKDARYNIEHAEWMGPKKFVYNGERLTPWRFLLMSKLLDSKICSMSYSNNVSVGTATVTLRGRGKYYGSKTMSFTIVPEETPLRKPTSDVDSITVKWKKQSKRMKKTRITGYQIQYSTSKSFASGNKKTTVKGYSNTSKVIKNLKSGKKYYIRIRTYKTVNDKKYYSYWSEPRSIRTKTE